MTLLYFLIGMLAAIIGALPSGASNIAVINTTLKQDAKQAFKIAITAGIAEVLLSLFALHCSMTVTKFAKNNVWIQIVIVIFLAASAVYLFFKKQK